MKKSIYSEEYKYFLRKLIKARKEIGLTQKQVAVKIKKPQSFVSKFETGERRLDVIELKELAKIYKKPVNYFIKK
jgi:transcriptional regulator with XRE-family HTH domain